VALLDYLLLAAQMLRCLVQISLFTSTTAIMTINLNIRLSHLLMRGLYYEMLVVVVCQFISSMFSHRCYYFTIFLLAAC